MLSVVECLQGLQDHLVGTQFKVWTEFVNDNFFHVVKEFSPMHTQWQESLKEYDFVWKNWHTRCSQVGDDALLTDQVNDG